LIVESYVGEHNLGNHAGVDQPFCFHGDRASFPFVQPDAPVCAFYLANVGGGAPVNLVLLGVKTETRWLAAL